MTNDAARRLGVIVVGSLVLAVLAWRVVTLGAADHFARQSPQRALDWRPDHPEALVRLAEGQLQRGQLAGIGDTARAALQANPLEGRAYRVLAQVAELKGDRPQTVDWFSIANQRSPRDLHSLLWLAEHRLAQRDPQAALALIDTALRVEPEASQHLGPVFVRLANERSVHPALLGLLSKSPPWRSEITKWVLNGSNVNNVAPLVEGLRLAKAGLTEYELDLWLNRLMGEKRWGQAYLIWANQLPAERRLALGNIFDGGFEFSPNHGGFGWQFTTISGARIDRLPGDRPDAGQALRVAFEDRRVAFQNVTQTLALPPGTYRFSGWARPDQLRSERGLVWSVSCFHSQAELGVTEPVRGHGAWREISFVFKVPEQDCGGQRLGLRIPARIPAEQRIGGKVWFDNLKVSRLAGGRLP